MVSLVCLVIEKLP